MSMSGLQKKLSTKQELVVDLKTKIEEAKQKGKLRVMEDLRSELADVTKHIDLLRRRISNLKEKDVRDKKKRLEKVGT